MLRNLSDGEEDGEEGEGEEEDDVNRPRDEEDQLLGILTCAETSRIMDHNCEICVVDIQGGKVSRTTFFVICFPRSSYSMPGQYGNWLLRYLSTSRRNI